MITWQERALELSANGLKHRQIAEHIENEFGLTDMYQKVRCYIYRNRDAKPGVSAIYVFSPKS